jgi:hypothetical protein
LKFYMSIVNFELRREKKSFTDVTSPHAVSVGKGWRNASNDMMEESFVRLEVPLALLGRYRCLSYDDMCVACTNHFFLIIFYIHLSIKLLLIQHDNNKKKNSLKTQKSFWTPILNFMFLRVIESFHYNLKI